MKKMKQFLQKIKQKILSKYFWKRNRRLFFIFISVVVVVALLFVLLIDGQKDVGAKEAGTELSALAQNIRRHYKIRPDFWGLSTREVIGKRLYPSTMTARTDSLHGYFGAPTTVGADENGTVIMPTGRQFAIAYHNLTKQQCVGLGSYKFSQDFWLGLKKVSLNNQKETYSFEWGNKDFRLPLERSQLREMCRPQTNTLVFYFE